MVYRTDCTGNFDGSVYFEVIKQFMNYKMEQRASVSSGRHVWRYLQSSAAEVRQLVKATRAKVQLEKSEISLLIFVWVAGANNVT
jgi:hypothetical protein